MTGHTITVWFCSFCRNDVQVGARPAKCEDCDDDDCLEALEVPYVAP